MLWSTFILIASILAVVVGAVFMSVLILLLKGGTTLNGAIARILWTIASLRYGWVVLERATDGTYDVRRMTRDEQGEFTAPLAAREGAVRDYVRGRGRFVAGTHRETQRRPRMAGRRPCTRRVSGGSSRGAAALVSCRKPAGGHSRSTRSTASSATSTSPFSCSSRSCSSSAPSW